MSGDGLVVLLFVLVFELHNENNATGIIDADMAALVLDHVGTLPGRVIVRSSSTTLGLHEESP